MREGRKREQGREGYASALARVGLCSQSGYHDGYSKDFEQQQEAVLLFVIDCLHAAHTPWRVCVCVCDRQWQSQRTAAPQLCYGSGCEAQQG